MKSVFNKKDLQEIISRINQLKVDSKPLWGKMTAAQMLAHNSVTYEMVYTDLHPKPGVLMKCILKLVIKKFVVNEKPYKKNLKTASWFVVKDEKKFEDEKKKLIAFIRKTQKLGSKYFDHKKSHSFGILTKSEWNNMFYKHIDHHLCQFEV